MKPGFYLTTGKHMVKRTEGAINAESIMSLESVQKKNLSYGCSTPMAVLAAGRWSVRHPPTAAAT